MAHAMAPSTSGQTAAKQAEADKTKLSLNPRRRPSECSQPLPATVTRTAKPFYRLPLSTVRLRANNLIKRVILTPTPRYQTSCLQMENFFFFP